MCSFYLVENATDISNSETIFIKQYEKLINQREQVLILSAFPHFIIDIFGIERYCEIWDWTFTFKIFLSIVKVPYIIDCQK